MSRLDEVGEQDQWRCWLCDEAVDPSRSVNDDRGPSVDSMQAGGKAGGGNKSAKTAQRSAKDGAPPLTGERLAHRACNTRKGAVLPVIPWPTGLFVADPAPLFAVSQRLARKGGREVVARCPSRDDADAVALWLVDRFTRLVPEMPVTAAVEPGGGQFMIALAAPRSR
ncbi:MAG: hypothetical protein JWN95_3404 [Frankiales bacterium]|nr:hypothetical protein [Frankiales bacterium]